MIGRRLAVASAAGVNVDAAAAAVSAEVDWRKSLRVNVMGRS